MGLGDVATSIRGPGDAQGGRGGRGPGYGGQGGDFHMTGIDFMLARVIVRTSEIHPRSFSALTKENLSKHSTPHHLLFHPEFCRKVFVIFVSFTQRGV